MRTKKPMIERFEALDDRVTAARLCYEHLKRTKGVAALVAALADIAGVDVKPAPPTAAQIAREREYQRELRIAAHRAAEKRAEKKSARGGK